MTFRHNMIIDVWNLIWQPKEYRQLDDLLNTEAAFKVVNKHSAGRSSHNHDHGLEISAGTSLDRLGGVACC